MGRSPRRKPKPRAKRGPLTVREVAKLVRMTTQGVYLWIKRGDVRVSYDARGRYAIARRDAEAMKREIAERAKPTRKRKYLTDEEFLQALWDSDPD